MRIYPIQNRVSFGIYLKTIKTDYGYKDVGKYKKYNITICYDIINKLKLYYVDIKGNLIRIKPKFIRSKK